MSYKISFSDRPGYIHALVTGENSRDSVVNYMEEVLRECKDKDCFRVLIEERLEGPRLQTMDVFTVSSEGSMKVLGVFEAIAHVDENMGEMRDFAETVAVNRGLPIATFSTIAEAKTWLGQQQSADDEKRIFFDP